MANWVGAGRTNYFRVKDDAAFEAMLDKIGGVEVWTQPDDPKLFGLGFGDGFWPSSTEDGTDIDFVDLVSKHLESGQVAVFQVAGAEKLRYVTGIAVAVDHTGKQIVIDIDHIYGLAQKEFVVEPTLAQY